MAEVAKWRRHSIEFKREAVERMKTCDNIRQLARELQVQQKLLYTWKYQFEGRPEPKHANLAETAEDRRDRKYLDEIAKLKSALADKSLELDFFRDALHKVEETHRQSKAAGVTTSTTSSGRGRKSKAD